MKERILETRNNRRRKRMKAEGIEAKELISHVFLLLFGVLYRFYSGFISSPSD